MKVAVIILNYNSAADCRKCVGFLMRQKGVELEIVVVDNASRPEDASEVENLCKEFGLTFIPATENRGYNAGNNIGLRYASEKGYEYALIANPDMEFPDPDYVHRLAAELSRHQDVVAIGSDIITPEGIHQNPKVRGDDDWKNSFNWLSSFVNTRKDRSNVRDVTIPEWVDNPGTSHFCRCLNGCCLMIKMSFLREIGFFDERTFLYGEEPIFGRQVELAGKRMYYFAAISAIHDHKKSREGSSAFCRGHWRRSQLIYIRHYSRQPWYGKWVAELSSNIYFMMLKLNSWLRNK